MTTETECSRASARWYAVWTRSRQEKSAAMILDALSIPHYLPMKSELRQWSDRKQTIWSPLFSGYLFVRIDLGRENQLQVLQTPGIVSLVGNQTGPLPIPDQEIESIRKVLDCGASYTECDLLKTGDRVRVVRGALAGVEGTLIRVHSETRLVLSVEMIQRSIAVSVSRLDVEFAMTDAA